MPIVKFIVKHCSKKVVEDIKRLMEEDKSLFTVTDKPDLKKVHDIIFLDATVVSVNPRLKTSNLILLHISLQVESEGCFGFDDYDAWSRIKSEITIDYYLAFHGATNYELFFVEARPGIKECYAEKNTLGQNLIPEIAPEVYDDEATLFLREVYPEALDKPMPINVFDVASRLNLQAKPFTFTNCHPVLGKTYFKHTTDEAGVIEEGTVLYETNHGNTGRLNNTIMHECFHWYKHRHYFALKNLLGTDNSAYRNDFKARFHLERQARMLTPRILMPKKMFLRKTQELIDDWKDSSALDYLHILEQVICQLALFFQVSRQSAKIRLVELGFKEAKGVLEYIDGAYLPVFGFCDTELKNNQTFSISLADMECLMAEDTSFESVVRSGRYVYLEAHLVMNLPQFVTKDAIGNLILTEYARYHLDECALLFEFRRKAFDQNEISYQEFVLNRAQFSNISFELVYRNGYENSTSEKQEAALIKQLEEEDAIYQKLSNDFVASMQVIKKWRKVTYKEMADALDFSEKQISRFFNGDGSLELFLLVCVYLNLPPTISTHLLEKSKWKLDPSNITHRRYQLILNSLYSHSVEQVKDFLRKVGITL